MPAETLFADHPKLYQMTTSMLMSYAQLPWPSLTADSPRADSRYKRNADQLGMEVIEMLWEVGVDRFC